METRGQLLDVLEKVPKTVRRSDMPELFMLLSQVTQIHKAFVDEPFEYLSPETKQEHRNLSSVFMRLLALLQRQLYEATMAFRRDCDTYELSDELAELRDELEEKSEGGSVLEMLLSRYAQSEAAKE